MANSLVSFGTMGISVAVSIFLLLILTTVESYRIIDAFTPNAKEKTVTAKPLRFEGFYQTLDPIGSNPQPYIAPNSNVLILPTSLDNPTNYDAESSSISNQTTEHGSKSYEGSLSPAADNEKQGFSATVSHIKPTSYLDDTLHSDVEKQKKKETPYHQHKHLHEHDHKHDHDHANKYDHQHRSRHSYSHRNEYRQREQKQDHRHEHVHQHKREHNHDHRSEHYHSHAHQHGHEGMHDYSHGSDDKHLHQHQHVERHRHDRQSKLDHKRNFGGLYQRISIKKTVSD